MSGRGRFNTRSSNQGYQKPSYNTRNNSYSSPAYSTPQGGGYQKDHQHTPQHQQYHQEQQETQPPQPQVTTPVTQKPEPPAVQVATPKVQPPAQTPPVQTPPATPKPENNGPAETDVKMGDEEEDGKRKIAKSWFKRRTPDFKVPRRIRKRRQNARLKNILAPKNAMMVLHELHPELKMSVTEIVNAASQQSYSVEIEIDGQTFKGMGMSKMSAKQAGSEAALKAVLLKKLEEINVKLSAQSAANKVEEGWDEDVSMSDVTETKAIPTPDPNPNPNPVVEGGEQNGAAIKPKNHIPEDDVPWGSLASFALYKLFSEWQSQGFQVPAVSGLQNVLQPKPIVPQHPTPMKKLPEDAHTKHPVQLLNQIRPGSQYIESREGAPPNFTFTFSVIVDDLTFKGVGASKKDAKKQCAKHALEHLGVVYND